MKSLTRVAPDGSASVGHAAEVMDVLIHGEVVAVQSIAWSSNYTFVAHLRRGDKPDLLAVYKPRRGEIPLWDFPNGSLFKRERAAYVVSGALGWHFIPPTIIRNGPHGVGSFQLLVDADPQADYFAYRERYLDDLRRIALFDVMTNNADRKAGHCLLDRQGRLWGIDHGLTFNTAYKLRTVIWDFAGEPMPPRLLDQVEKLRCNPARFGRLMSSLAELLDDGEVRRFEERVDTVLEHRMYPPPSARRAMPWPWY
jgi:hypothetical protein